MEQERQKIRRFRERNRELEALYERLSRLEFASESFVIFYENKDGEMTVTTGHRYASLIEPGKFVKGWCYIELPSPAGTSRNFFIANMNSDASVTPSHITETALKHAGLSRADVVAARERCTWPEKTA